MNVFWFFFSCFLIGTGKAARDTIAHHYLTSVFFNVQNRWTFLNLRFRTWLTKWFESNWNDWPLHFGLFRLDAWHFFDLLHYIGVGLLVSSSIYYNEMDWTAGIVALPVIGFTFMIFYKIFFIRKESR